ncbi:uncharacterized protein LOC142612043 [Castanea sativa]|uniref:uncharacterized protein LOC142612043 n=1 Tax=Castanea sativa TaxID=21020 RepID=UPI003F64B42F
MTAALHRFISRSANRCRPFFQILKKWKGFQWTDECQQAFKELKLQLSRALILSRLVPRETLYMYQVVTNHTISVVLIRVDQGIQKPIFYVSKTLVEVETQYLPLQKAALAVIHAMRRLPHYFQAHTVIVLTEHSLQALLRSQVWGELETKDQRMISYLKEVGIMKCQFKQLKISHISREGNSHVDSLVTLASTVADPFPRIVSVELLPYSSLTLPSNVAVLRTDYFTKWVEVEPLANIHDIDVKNIVTRFGGPKILISDNGLQFNSKAFQRYYSELGIINRYSTPSYPQKNGQAEETNKSIVNGLKRRLDDLKARWTEELPSVLWAYRTIPRRSIGETPFSMNYGAEAVIPIEIGLPTSRTEEFQVEKNNQLLCKHLDLIEENHDNASVKLANYQQKISQGYNKGVKSREFIPGDLMLRKVVWNT